MRVLLKYGRIGLKVDVPDRNAEVIEGVSLVCWFVDQRS
jgi:hypothetical protein